VALRSGARFNASACAPFTPSSPACRRPGLVPCTVVLGLACVGVLRLFGVTWSARHAMHRMHELVQVLFWTCLFEAGVCMRQAPPGLLPCLVPGVLARCHRMRAKVQASRLSTSGCHLHCTQSMEPLQQGQPLALPSTAIRARAVPPSQVHRARARVCVHAPRAGGVAVRGHRLCGAAAGAGLCRRVRAWPRPWRSRLAACCL